jgi:predicted phage terminase large subunit-like protein
MTDQIELLDRALANRSLAEFVRQAWPILEPQTPLVWNWHIELVCEWLEEVTAGRVTRLVLNLPPRFMKSILVSVMWPCWEWAMKPGNRWVFLGYSANLSTKHSVDRRTLITSEWYRRNFPHVRLAEDLNLKNEFSNLSRGHMFSTSIGGTLTGKGGNRIVCDDPQSVDQAESEVERENTWRFFAETVGSRLDDPKKDAIVVVQQRVNLADISGRLLEQGGYTHVCLPAEFERKTVITFPRSGRKIVKEEGDLLWPERLDSAELARIKQQIGPFAYAAQYLQNPVPRGGAIFKEEWLRQSYRTIPRAFDGGIVLSLDTAYKTSNTSDFSAAVVVGHLKHPDSEHAPGFYLLWAWQSRCEFPDLVKMTVSLAERWRVNVTLVEDAASGPSLVQSLQRETSLAVVPVKVDRDKISRATAITPLLESGRLFLPETGPWIETLKAQLLSFPQGAHDDLVDALSQALNYLREQKEDQAMGWLRLLEEQSRSSGRPGPAVGIAYEAAKMRAEIRARMCVVCHRPIGTGTYIRLGLDYVHVDCEGKPIEPAVPVT